MWEVGCGEKGKDGGVGSDAMMKQRRMVDPTAGGPEKWNHGVWRIGTGTFYMYLDDYIMISCFQHSICFAL